MLYTYRRKMMITTDLFAIQHLPFYLFATFFLLTFFFKLLFNITRHKPNLPPSPWRLPIIGNFHQLGSLPHRSLQALSNKHGPIMLLHLGSTPAIVVSSEEIAREVMKTHDIVFASRPILSMAQRFLYGSTDVAFAPYGDYWRRVRKVCVVHLLSIKMVKSFRSVREEEVSLFIEKINESRDGIVNLSKMLVSLTNNILCRAALGKKYFGEEGGGYDFSKTLEEAVYYFGLFHVRDFIPWLGWIDRLSGLDASMIRNFQEIDGFLDKVFDEHLHGQGRASDGDDEGSNFVDVLLSLHEKDEMGGISLSRDNMKAIVLDMFVAGTESVYTAIEWVMAELIKNTKAMKRSQREVRQVIGSEGKITEESTNKMTYLKAVIKETFRLHPPGTLLVPRETTEDIKLLGYDIPARTRVIVNAWAIGRDIRSWERPEVFDPERFMNYDIDFKGQDFCLIPFGAGRRVCPGVAFTTTVMELTLAHLLLHFDWELPYGMSQEEVDMSETPGISVHKRSNLILVAKPRCP